MAGEEGSHSKVSCRPPVQDLYKEFLPPPASYEESTYNTAENDILAPRAEQDFEHRLDFNQILKQY